MIKIRKTDTEQLEDILDVETRAFGEPEEAELTEALMRDPSASPYLSLVAYDGDAAVGHILFTYAEIRGNSASVSLLAPLAVVPERQKEGIGGMLIEEGCRRLRKQGVELIFVLGHPTYYPKYGFSPAVKYGWKPLYYIPLHDEAWMVRKITELDIDMKEGPIHCADSLDHIEMWRE